MSERHTPGGELVRKELHFFWLVDCSGSMDGTKIGTVNYAIRDCIPLMRTAAEDNPHVKVVVRAIRFGNAAEWHVQQPTPVENFSWAEVNALGSTAMGKALTMLAQELKLLPRGRVLPPVIVLMSDGHPTDDFDSGLAALDQEPLGAKAIRIAIAIGEDADRPRLTRFIGAKSDLKAPLEAGNPQELVDHIRWATTLVKTVSEAKADVRLAPQPIPRAVGSGSKGNVPLTW